MLFLVLCTGFLSIASCDAAKPKPLVYNGDTLPMSSLFTRRQVGMVKESAGLPEVSGIACSRVTPGYLWMQSDDYEDRIIATDMRGINRYLKVKFSKTIRWDWEDMSGGVYNDTNYLFIGAFGDNDETDGNYHIVYLPEPAITSEQTEITLTPSSIRFVYPDGKNHNAEALMYDNIEQVIYVITKVYYNVCQVFSLPFRLDYGNEVQTLTYVCDLGVRSDLGDGANPFKGFHLVTAADISPDGKYILVKNHNNIQAVYSWILLWEREGDESVTETLRRQPVALDCYQYEWQGEAMCWLDSTTFFTTSDSDGEPPIYQYTRRSDTALPAIEAQPDRPQSARLVRLNGVLYLRYNEHLYTLDGKKLR